MPGHGEGGTGPNGEEEGFWDIRRSFPVFPSTFLRLAWISLHQALRELFLVIGILEAGFGRDE